MEWKQVTKKEYQEMLNNYPNKLDWDVTGICDPPLGSHNDFSNGKVWPESMVGKVMLYDGSEYDSFKEAEYYLPED